MIKTVYMEGGGEEGHLKTQRRPSLGLDAKMGLYVQNNVQIHRGSWTRPPELAGSIAGTLLHLPRMLANFEHSEKNKGAHWAWRQENGRELFWTL